MRPTLDETGLALARVWARRATCPRRCVGCVLFDADGFPIGAGYNGPAAGEPHCTEHPCPGARMASGTGLDACAAIHAEANAIVRCANFRAIHTCYVTVSPCNDCIKLLMGTSCRRVVFGEEYVHPQARERWLRHAAKRGWFDHPEASWVHVPVITREAAVEAITPHVASRQGYDWEALNRIERTSIGPSQNELRSIVFETLRLGEEIE